MSSTAKSTTKEPPKGAKPEEIEQHIEQTRRDLGSTIEALSHKLDVKSQAQEKLGMARDRAGSVGRRLKMLAMRPMTMMVAGGTAVVAAVAGAVAWKRRH
ncbi:DUF3618 domain-containing protein [Jiangella asiatica]|uniref:DUF3618 domain-containing protein n=1 Tax=Jiangella asiatica TaxID=2530372 RepID=A0A4R5D4A6_9ACTN|nr:DUF3618 domain-containing protein [Jiangella asiatica]TDE08229.1 DUF3618 domain-containing protein [Jiangella asiatica]